MKRIYETDYAGAWRGFCATRESAISAGMRHLLNDGYTRCTITNRENGQAVARLQVSADRTAVHVHTVTPLKRGPK
jgi:hypothetical protein